MSAAAAGYTPSSSGARTSGNSLDAASCVWENEPMSAAATLSSAPRLTLPRASAAAKGLLDDPSADEDGANSATLGRSRLAGISRGEGRTAAVSVSSSRSGVLGLRPHRQAPLPPVVQRSNSFPSREADDEYLEFEVTSSLTLKETPRSQRREGMQREIWERQAQIARRALGGSEAAPEITESDPPHVSFSFPAVSKADADAHTDALVPFQSNTSAEVAAVLASIMPSLHVDLQTNADAVQMLYEHADTAALSVTESDSADTDAGQVTDYVKSRRASVITLNDFAHSGAMSDSGDVDMKPDDVAV